jgi:serine/threonine protein kinase
VTHRPPESRRWRVKVGDFGISERVSSESTALRTKVGTALYQAPEVMDNPSSVDPHGNSDYDSAVDMWSLGCVVYNLAAGIVPFSSAREIFAFCLGAKPLAEEPLKHKLGEKGVIFVKRLLQPVASDRISVQDAMSDSWLLDDCLKVEWDEVTPSWARSLSLRLKDNRVIDEDGPQDPRAARTALPSGRVRTRPVSSVTSNTIAPAQPPLRCLDRAGGNWSLLTRVRLPDYLSRIHTVSSLLGSPHPALFLPDNRFINRTRTAPLVSIVDAMTGESEGIDFTNQRILDPMRTTSCLASVSPVKFEIAMTSIGSRDNYWQ